MNKLNNMNTTIEKVMNTPKNGTVEISKNDDVVDLISELKSKGIDVIFGIDDDGRRYLKRLNAENVDSYSLETNILELCEFPMFNPRTFNALSIQYVRQICSKINREHGRKLSCSKVDESTVSIDENPFSVFMTDEKREKLMDSLRQLVSENETQMSDDDEIL